MRHIRDIKYVVVNTEEDALLLENNLIKRYKPHYNVLLKDDKSYPWIVITKELYPRIFMTRERGLDARYYGPYSNLQSAKVVLDLIRETVPLRSCRHALDERGIARNRFSLCLDYHIGKCAGPCNTCGRRETCFHPSRLFKKYIILFSPAQAGENASGVSHTAPGAIFCLSEDRQNFMAAPCSSPAIDSFLRPLTRRRASCKIVLKIL